MTVEEYNAKLSDFIVELKQKNIPFDRAVQSSVQQVGNRIFVEGKKTNGEPIGQYNTTDPLYVNPDKDSPKTFPKKGKEGNTKFKDGKDHKTGYFDSYADFRAEIGRPIDTINLVLSGDLQSDFRKAEAGQPAEATKISPTKYVVQLDREINEKKFEGAEDRFGEISNMSVKELEDYQIIGEKELINAMAKKGLL